MCFQINRENAATATIVGIMIKVNEIYIYIYIYICRNIDKLVWYFTV